MDQDAHILYTLSALQVLVMYDALDRVDIDAISRCKFEQPACAVPAPATSLACTASEVLRAIAFFSQPSDRQPRLHCCVLLAHR